MGDITWGDVAVIILAFAAVVTIGISLWINKLTQRNMDKFIEGLENLSGHIDALSEEIGDVRESIKELPKALARDLPYYGA